MAELGLVRAAARLAGDDADDVCASMQHWRDRRERELPWLAGPGLSALSRIAAAPAGGTELQVLERFLVGAETDPDRVRVAIAILEVREDRQEPPVPPDARGALVEAASRFFHLLGLAYAACHRPVRDGHRMRVDDVVAQWQPQLDSAAAVITERARVLTGETAHVPVAPPRRVVHDRLPLAMGFAVVALLTAGAVIWMVLQGWPMKPVDLPF